MGSSGGLHGRSLPDPHEPGGYHGGPLLHYGGPSPRHWGPPPRHGVPPPYYGEPSPHHWGSPLSVENHHPIIEDHYLTIGDHHLTVEDRHPNTQDRPPDTTGTLTGRWFATSWPQFENPPWLTKDIFTPAFLMSSLWLRSCFSHLPVHLLPTSYLSKSLRSKCV